MSVLCVSHFLTGPSYTEIYKVKAINQSHKILNGRNYRDL